MGTLSLLSSHTRSFTFRQFMALGTVSTPEWLTGTCDAIFGAGVVRVHVLETFFLHFLLTLCEEFGSKLKKKIYLPPANIADINNHSNLPPTDFFTF